jgi:NhaA family Na+:H+ antiporter
MIHDQATMHPTMRAPALPAPIRSLVRLIHVLFDRFLLFPIGAAIALVWANTASESYFVFAQRLAFAVNEIGMAFFFALLAQEVVEAVMPGGALHSWRKWSMPIVAAIGGMAGAVSIYLLYVNLEYQDILSPAWPIACAIDAAATYYVLRTIMPRSSALPFALLLAIVTDFLGMIFVAPRFLVLQTRVGGAALLMLALGLAWLMRAVSVRAFWPYLLICGGLSWIAFYWEGLHPAFALLPIVPFLPHEPRKLNLFADPRDDDAVHHAEHEWHLWVQVVVFLFALVNAGVILNDYGTGSWAMLTAQLVGRPLGILIAVAVAVVLGLHLPHHLGWRELLIIAFASSSGFAIALFFATGLLAIGPVLGELKIGIIGSVSGALLAFGAARALKVGKFGSPPPKRVNGGRGPWHSV